MKDEMPPDDRPSDAALVRYLLGTVSSEDGERFDELSVVDPRFLERLRALEHDLADAYVRGELSNEDRERWQQRYLASPEGRDDLRLAQTLAERERRSAVSAPRWTFRWGLAAAAALALATVAGYLATRPATMPAAPVASTVGPEKPAQPRAPATASPAGVVAMTLSAPTRSLTQPPVLRVPAGTSDVKLTLRLEPDDYSIYDVAVRSLASDTVVWRGTHLENVRTADGIALVVTIPAAAFTRGRYVVDVTGLGARQSENVGTYALQVMRE
jgi:hypothetical protein